MSDKLPQLWTREELEALVRDVLVRDQEERGEQLVARLQELARMGIKFDCAIK